MNIRNSILSEQGIVFVFMRESRTTTLMCSVLRKAIIGARSHTKLPICLGTTEKLAKQYKEIVDHIVIVADNLTSSDLRMSMCDWVPYNSWLYLDYDALIIGSDIDFGFSILDKGYDCAVCSIACEADKSCFGDSAQFESIFINRPDIPKYIFYPQLGTIYQKRSMAMMNFEKHWIQTYNYLQLNSYVLQPSFAVAHYDFGIDLKIYLLPPHFNCRKEFKETVMGRNLPTSYFPRNNTQIIHDKNWYR